MANVVSALKLALGEHAVLTGEEIGERYCVDFSGENPHPPLAVARPASTQELAAILRACSSLGQKVVVQGGMSGLAGGATPLENELAVSLERLSGIEELDADAMTLTALAGTPLQLIQETAEHAGLLFPLDLGARGSCTIGGNIATNAGGNEVMRFGMIRNLVLGLEVVLADGTIVSSMNKMLKNNAGYDLKQLFIGTEGTLGVVTRAVLRLFPKLPSKCTALCALQRFEDAVRLLNELQARLGGSLSAYEVMWSSYFHYVVDHVRKLRSPFARPFPIYALIETAGVDQTADLGRFEQALGWALGAGLIDNAAIAQSDKDVQAFWEIRDGIGDITPQLYPVAVFDVSMPVGEMKAFLDEVDERLRKSFNQVINLPFGHIADSNLHLAVTTGAQEDMTNIYDIVYEATGEHGGSVSAEHGIGTLRRGYLHYCRSPEEIALMKRLKAALDPKGILNNARVLPD